MTLLLWVFSSEGVGDGLLRMAASSQQLGAGTLWMLRGCRNLTDAAIIGLADCCPAITNIDVSSCYKLTDGVTSLSFVST